MSDRGGASHGCDTGWIRAAAAARPCCCCSAPLVQPPGSALCSAVRAQRALLHPAAAAASGSGVCAPRLGNQAAARGKVWSKSRARSSFSVEQVAAAALLCCTERCSAHFSAAVEQAVRQRASAPGSVSGSRGSALHCRHFFTHCRARALPFRLGKTCLCFQHDGPASHCHIYLSAFHKYFSDEFQISTENLTKKIKERQIFSEKTAANLTRR